MADRSTEFEALSLAFSELSLLFPAYAAERVYCLAIAELFGGLYTKEVAAQPFERTTLPDGFESISEFEDWQSARAAQNYNPMFAVPSAELIP